MLLSVIVPFFLLILTLGDAQEKTVTTHNGAIKGRLEYSMRNGLRFYAFNKIPFAQPPLGELRFKEPQPVDPWNGTLDATVANGPICFQVAEWGNFSDQTEDCLYLNVYTPTGDSTDGNYAVLFYLFGGGFISGASGFYQAGPHYLIEDDVIIVTTNYRVGPFGFLSTGDEVIPGNNGLKDQNLALQWVRDNIGYFGGDPQKVTLMGSSAGGASVTYHFMSKQSRDLFRAGISHSGSLLCPWSYIDQAKILAYQLAAKVNPTFNQSATSSELLALLKSVTAKQINDAAKTFPESIGNEQIVQGFFWAPVIEPTHENAFITEPMYSAVEGGRMEHVPLLIGINSEEALDRISNSSLFLDNVKAYDANVTTLVNRNMHYTDYGQLSDIGESIRHMYTSGLLQDNLANAIRYFSDMSFTRSIIRHAHMQSINSDVYFYQFSYHGKLGGRDNYIPGAERVAHGEESNYVWCYGNNSASLDSYPAEDVLTSERFRRLLTNFVKYLNPTPEASSLLQNITWPKVQNWNFSYLNINDSLTVEKDPKDDTYQKWVKLYDGTTHRPFITY